MSVRHARPLYLIIVAAAAATLAACGSTSGAGAGSVNTSLGPQGTVGAVKTGLGTVLVDAHGRTLYELSVDTPGRIACAGTCAAIWPPYTVPAGTKPMSGGGVAATLTTVRRPDGTMQVEADGHPLYDYSRDTGAGQTSGEGVQDTGGTWYALTEGGQPVMSAGTPSHSSGVYGHY